MAMNEDASAWRPVCSIGDVEIGTPRRVETEGLPPLAVFQLEDGYFVTDDLVASRRVIYAQPSMKRAIHHILALHTPEAREKYAIKPEQWKALNAPTLVLWTDHDPTATVEVGQQLADSIPGAQFVVMKDCGHWPQFEDADTFNRIHIEFLRNG